MNPLHDTGHGEPVQDPRHATHFQPIDSHDQFERKAGEPRLAKLFARPSSRRRRICT